MVAANPLVAQRSIFVFGHGGGFSSLEDLNAAGTADFDTAFNVGGGVGLQLNKYLAVRGSLDFAKSDVRGFGLERRPGLCMTSIGRAWTRRNWILSGTAD